MMAALAEGRGRKWMEHDRTMLYVEPRRPERVS